VSFQLQFIESFRNIISDITLSFKNMIIR